MGNINLDYDIKNSGLLKEPPKNSIAHSPHILYHEALVDYPTLVIIRNHNSR